MQGENMVGQRIANWPGCHWRMPCHCGSRAGFTICT
jgi:hypothetical protein